MIIDQFSSSDDVQSHILSTKETPQLNITTNRELFFVVFFCRNCLRRIIHDDKEFSNQSIINVIERFVKSVNMMEETILIPSRLMDRQVRL